MSVDECCEMRDVPREQRRVLHAVLAINAAMFLVESVAGLASHSTALLGDSLDMFGNVGVLFAALAVALSGSAWPDVVIGLIIAGVFGRSALQIVRQARRAVA